MIYPILDTVGLEFETENIYQRNRIEGFSVDGFSTTHDASIESDAILSRSGLVFKKTNCGFFAGRGNVVIGTEFISQPTDLTEVDFLSQIKKLTNFLMRSGETEIGLRSGIHIHVNFPYNLSVLKQTIRLGQFLEDLFYLLAGNGNTFRGVENEAIYTRPITGFGPPIVSTGFSYIPVFNVNDLLQSEKLSEFWYRYGNLIPREGRIEKYHPARYTWLNLHSILLHGTLEFRPFNKSLNPYFIWAEIQLCRKFAEYVFTRNYANLSSDGFNIENSIYLGREKREIINTFNAFAKVVELDPTISEIIKDIIHRTPLYKQADGWVFSHLRNQGTFYMDSSKYRPNDVNSSHIHRVKVVDIHTLRGER